MGDPGRVMRPSNVPCWHCGSTDSISPAAIVDRDGRERKVALCNRCYGTRSRWRGWRPADAVVKGAA
jgi:hypothetical protein